MDDVIILITDGIPTVDADTTVPLAQTLKDIGVNVGPIKINN